MIIIAGYSLAKSVEDRDVAVAAFAEMVGRARTQDGCIDMAITADSLDPTRSNIIEIWRDEQAWKAWRKVAKGPRSRAQESHVALYRSDTVEKLA
jgi:heme-degrading monooxygenase HmoA